MKKGLTELVCILDCSGSMHGLERDTIGGFNAMLATQQALDIPCNDVMSETIAHYRSSSTIPVDWNKKIKKDFKERKR